MGGATGSSDTAPCATIQWSFDLLTPAEQSALAPAVTERLERMRTPATSLSSRETEVLTLVADGLSNQ